MNTKLLSNVYAGLANLQNLRAFHLRCPSDRYPRPICEIPPMPNLRGLTVTQYDPLCYPDDISTLLLHAIRLEDLTIHMSPRMRDNAEPSVHWLYFFRKNIAAKRPLQLKSIGVYNLFAHHNPEEAEMAANVSGLERLTFLNSAGLEDDIDPMGEASNTGVYAFFDQSWSNRPLPLRSLKSLRHDRLTKAFAQWLSEIRGLEELYIVNARHSSPSAPLSVAQPEVELISSTPSPSSTPPHQNGMASLPRASLYSPISHSLRDIYLDAICICHGPSLRHLILPSRWPLSPLLVAKLIRSCPNLSQFAFAIETPASIQAFRLIIPFMQRLWAIRLLTPSDGNSSRIRDFDAFVAREAENEQHMAEELARGDFQTLRYVGLGDAVWEIGGMYQTAAETSNEAQDQSKWASPNHFNSSKPDNVALPPIRSNPSSFFRRRLKRLNIKDMAHVEIWKMDSLDVV